MKKLLLAIASFAVLLVTVSAFVDKRQEAAFGEKAPEMVLCGANDTVSLSGFEGSWVILSFWSAADARSRMAQNMATSFMRGNGIPANANGIELVSVNFDRSERLMEEIVRLDNLDAESQFHVGNPDEAEALRRAYRMQEGLRTFLINPAGELVAVDPTEADLRAIIA